MENPKTLHLKNLEDLKKSGDLSIEALPSPPGSPGGFVNLEPTHRFDAHPLGETAQRLYDELAKTIQDGLPAITKLLDEYQQTNQSITNSPPATETFMRGAVAGGCAAYVLSFYTAKMLTLGLEEAFGKTAQWAFAPLAGVLHATAGEVIGGGLRSTFATYQSPDGAMWADLISATSNYMLYRASGRQADAQDARTAMTKAIERIQKSLDDRLGKDETRSNALAAAGAWWRSVVCDEVAFIAFAFAYVISGGIRPILRRMESHSASLGIEFGVVLSCGLIGGSMTCVLQNMMRRYLQRAAFTKGNNHNAERVARMQLLNITCDHLQRLKAQIQIQRQEYLDEIAAQGGGSESAPDPSAGSLNQSLLEQAKTTEITIEGHLQDFHQTLAALQAQEGIVPTCNAIRETGRKMFLTPADEKTYWVGRAAKWRRLMAKVTGNTAAVAVYVYYMHEVANAMYPLSPSPMGNQTGLPQSAPFSGPPPVSAGEMAAYSLHGFMLIGAWCARSVVSNATELGALSALPGMGVRVGTAAKAMCGWLSSRLCGSPAGATGQGEGTQTDVEAGIAHTDATGNLNAEQNDDDTISDTLVVSEDTTASQEDDTTLILSEETDPHPGASVTQQEKDLRITVQQANSFVVEVPEILKGLPGGSDQ